MVRLDVREVCGSTRVSRTDGEKLRRAIEGLWAGGGVLEIDFGGVPVASVSFLDESIGVLAKQHPLDVLKRRLRMKGLTEPDRALLNSILVSRAKERDDHVWRAALDGEEWVADVLWDDGTLLGLRVVRASRDAASLGENAWWDYAAQHFAGWEVADAPAEAQSSIASALAKREVLIAKARDRLLESAEAAARRAGRTGAEQLITLELETPEDVAAAKRLAREGKAMITGRKCVIRVTADAAE